MLDQKTAQAESDIVPQSAVGSALGDDLLRYQLLASAVAGRPIRVAPLIGEEAPYTDGRTIFLRSSSDHRTAVATMTVQGALIAAGSLNPEFIRRLVGRPSVARRYLLLEGSRALAELAAVIPGVTLPSVGTEIDPASSSPEDSLARALGRERLPEPPPGFGSIRPRRLLAAAGEDRSRSAQKSSSQTLSSDVQADRDDDDQDEEQPDRKPTPGRSSNGPGGKGNVARMLAKLLGRGRESVSGSAGAEAPAGGTRALARPGANGILGLTPVLLEPTELPSDQGGGFLYPEWDVHKREYQPRWCTVLEVDPFPEESRGFDPVCGADVRRRLARLGVGLERQRRQRQGDDIDIDAAIEARVEILSGSAPREAFYIEIQRRKRSLAVLILLDVSGSAGERTSEITVHERQLTAALTLTDALHALGDRVALYGFHSQGRSAVHFVRIKSFSDPLDSLTKARLTGLAPGGFTRLGAAIRHGGHLLSTDAGTDRRLLLVLSDGFAYDYGYDGAYGESDARRALSETRRKGIGCLCLSLGTSTDPAALQRVFGTAAHASAECLDDLAPHIGRLFLRAIASADLQRRLNQRRARSMTVMNGSAVTTTSEIAP